MKQYNKLFAILFAVLGISISAKAQTWTPSNVSAGTYYLYNVGAKKFLCSGNNWGSHASVTEGGIPVTLSGSGNVYTISTAAIYADKFLETEWMDGGAYNWTFEQVGSGVYKLKNGDNVLYWNGGTSTNTTFGADPNTEASHWMLVTEESRIADMANATQQNPIDATFLIKNAYLAKGNGHYFVRNGNYNSLSTSTSWKGTDLTDFWGSDVGTEEACYAIEQYGKTFDNYQELTLPNGKYFMTAKGFYRGNVVPYIYANSEKCNLKQKGDIGGDNLTNGAIALRGNDYLLDGVNVIVNNGTLRVGVKSDSNIDWCMFDDFKLVYYGKDLTMYENALENAIATAQGINQEELNTAVANSLKESIAKAESALVDANRTVESLEEQCGILEDAIALANSFIHPYATLLSLIDLCSTYAAESYSNVATEDVRSEFTDDITSATNEGNAATSVDALNEVYNTLEKARQEYVKVAIPTTGNSFDMTFLIKNALVASNEGWTNASINSGEQYSGAPDNTYLDWCRWDWTGNTADMYNDVSGLPAGTYSLKAATRAHSDMSGYIYAKTSSETYSTEIHKVGNSGNTLDKGWGWTEINDITVTDAILTIGFHVETTTNGVWAGADNFSLHRAYDETLAAPMQASVASLKGEAESLATKPMNVSVKTALTTAINNADATSTNPFALDEMIMALGNAIADAEASIATYELVSGYIAKANTIDESIAAEYQTLYNNRTLAEDVTAVFQTLEVATYNYVMSNFTYPVALSDEWNSKGTNTQAATFSNEHWSGEARPYKNQDDSNGQGWNADSWDINFDQSVTLPAGEYVFKVAGRKSEGTTLQLVVTMGETTLGTVEDFPASNNTRGVNKKGEASFDANDEAGFANGGNGFGWQWRYVKFTLAEEAEVTVAVHAEANEAHQWVSFGDYTLQMTEETYLEANKDGLNAALAPAEALVNTLPMGDAENTALQTAIDMPVTTGAEMLAKVEALNEAVAAANEWVAAYNETKAPLVAALERFEADYNDAENGALSHMNKARWATVINMAQAAAEAKDVTNNYDGFEAAANALIAALDAATVSIGEYADLKSAIENANTIISGGNIGNGPFQRPQSAVDALGTTNDEQAVYDAAEKDGEEVTSLTEALRNGCEIELNAPAEGARYNMIITYGGWEHDGKAVTYLANNRSDQGLYDIKYHAYTNVNYAQAFTFTAVEGQLNCYTLSMTDVDGNERYVCTGVVYGGNTSQLRTTTNAEEALAVKVIATTTDGIYNLYNTEASNYIGGQDAGFYTVDSHIDFNIVAAKKAEVALSISSAKWATLILPFNAELPEGVKAYSCGEADGENLTLVEAESFVANTPYLVSGEAGTYNFSDYGLATKDSYTDGLFTGTYVEYTTTPNSNTYVLQNGTEGVAFYRVGESAQPKVKPYRCYMTYEASAGAPVFRLGGTTGIDNAQADNVVVVYDLMGRKVSTMKKGGVYIVKGKKVVVK